MSNKERTEEEKQGNGKERRGKETTHMERSDDKKEGMEKHDKEDV